MGNKRRQACPLCGTILSENKYFAIIGLWDEKVKIERELKEKLKDAEKEKRVAIKEGIEKGKLKEQARANRLSRLVNKQTQDLQNAQSKIKELERHLKDGTTPQTSGLNFEKELVKNLENEFQEDFIEHHGKDGDILQRVFHKSREIGSILFECKKTAKFSKDYVHQTKRAVAARNANYGVLVTFVTKKDSQGFYVDNDVIVVHPFGAIHIARVLRSALIEMYSLKVNHKQLESRSQQLMDFIKSNDFRNSIENTIYRSQELAQILLTEYRSHNKIWKKRFAHYNGIYLNAHFIEAATKGIMNGLSIKRNSLKTDAKKLPAPNFDR